MYETSGDALENPQSPQFSPFIHGLDGIILSPKHNIGQHRGLQRSVNVTTYVHVSVGTFHTPRRGSQNSLGSPIDEFMSRSKDIIRRYNIYTHSHQLSSGTQPTPCSPIFSTEAPKASIWTSRFSRYRHRRINTNMYIATDKNARARL